MPYVKAISGHSGLAGARRYFERRGRALAHDYLGLDAPVTGEDGHGLPVYGDYAWDEAMDARRAAEGNDAPWRGRPARTYKHYVVSPDPRDGITLDGLRRLATRWAREGFPDFQVAIVYHDDNEGRVPHAHVIVNNTNLRTGRRLQDPDPGALNGRLQAISREMGLSHFDGRIDAGHPDTRGAGSRTDYQRVHVGRGESEMAGRGGYSWVADIRARVDVARGVAQGPEDFRRLLSSMGVTTRERRDGTDWTYSLADRPSRQVSGTRLGTDYRKAHVTRELASPRRARLPEQSRERIAQIARDAMEVHDLAELRRLASTVRTAREVRAMSLDGLDLAARRARSRGDERVADRISQARDHARERRLLPEHESHDDSTGGTHAGGTGDIPRRQDQAGPTGRSPVRGPRRDGRDWDR